MLIGAQWWRETYSVTPACCVPLFQAREEGEAPSPMHGTTSGEGKWPPTPFLVAFMDYVLRLLAFKLNRNIFFLLKI